MDPWPRFKLRNLMVLIAIIGLDWHVHSVYRRDGLHCRPQCINNLRQLAIALQGYMNAHGAYPNAGTFGERPEAFPWPGAAGL